MIEISLSGVQFAAPKIKRSDGVEGRVLSFLDPDSGIRVTIPATLEECEQFATTLRSDIAIPNLKVPGGPR